MNNVEYTHTGNNRFDRCKFAMTCNEGDGILFPSLFCTGDMPSSELNGVGASKPKIYSYLTSIILIMSLSLMLLILFRLLNSTTDEFFSPGLELFSVRLGLPPRFAGVVSSTM